MGGDPVAPSVYYEAKAPQVDPSGLPARIPRDGELVGEIERVHKASSRVYAARKVWRQLGRENFVAACCRVERLMRQRDLQGVVRGRGCRTTIAEAGTREDRPGRAVGQANLGSPRGRPRVAVPIGRARGSSLAAFRRASLPQKGGGATPPPAP